MSLINAFHKVGTRLSRKVQAQLGFITLGPRAIIINPDNQILLVKHTYQPHWYLPGGGLKRGESVKTALLRELQEEVGLTTTEEPELFAIYFHTYLGANDYPIIFVIRNYTMVDVRSPEIEQACWFHYHDLPEMVSPGTKRRLTEYFTKAGAAERW
jgi:ADP-ribose pyrophosphatase YjhB (NUDIX family)